MQIGVWRRLVPAIFVFFLVAGFWSDAQGQTKGAKKPDDKKDTKKEVKPPPPAKIAVQSERDTAIYKLDETASFLFASSAAGEVTYRLTDDGLTLVKDGKLKIKAGQTYKLDGKLDHPGFLRVELQQGETKAYAAVGIEPTKIEPTAKTPKDFDAFWDAQLNELAKVRIEPAIQNDFVRELIIGKSSATVFTYRIKLGMIDGRNVHGWLSIPKTAGPFPVILTVPGAGVYGIEPDHYHADLGAISINISIHDLPVDSNAEFYKKAAEGELKDYRSRGMDDKNKCYFRYAILAGVRALDFATTLKEFNSKEMAVTGSSQGGGLTLAISGLDQRVTLAAPNVAGLCDLNGRAFNRIDGWPHWLASVPADLKAKVEETSGYYDAVNFARKFKGKSLHGVGFLDTVCPPTTVYAAFNVHPEPKQIINSPLMGHATDPLWTKAREEFWKANLTLKPPTKKK